jgi:type IV pilus assembly protein PilQ
LRDYRVNYSKVDQISVMISKFLTPRGRITQDPRRNALMIEDVPSQFEKIDQLVKALDTPAQQVEIEARLLQANKSFSRDLGNQLGFLLGNQTGNVLTGAASGASPFSRTPAPRATSSSGGASSVPLLANFPAAATTSGLAFLLQGGNVLLDEIITAAEANGTAKLLSRPKVTTQNNQKADISRGTQIPVQTNVNNTISVQFIEFSLKLSVTPQITEAGTILLTVNIENSSPDFAKAVNGIPSVSTQHANTQVLIADGGTAMIGGILVDSDSQAIQQTPGLGSIQLLGHLFKSTQTIKSTDELLFFITPRIKPPDTMTGLDVPAPVATPAR